MTIREAGVDDVKRRPRPPMEPDPASPFMTITQVMKMLGCSRGTVRNLIKDGKLRVVYIRPHCPRILREDVLKLAWPPAA